MFETGRASLNPLREQALTSILLIKQIHLYFLAHQEQQALLERLEEAKRAFDCEQNKLERVRRDAHARAEQDRTYVNQLKDEMAALKTRLEEAKLVYLLLTLFCLPFYLCWRLYKNFFPKSCFST